MAYTSDTRIKNLIKDLNIDIRNQLIKDGFNKFPKLRVFDESSEDNLLFENGGLTFLSKNKKYKFGSNDAAWIYDDKPLVVVEGTFGTERGQFGDGQLNRFSHSLGIAVNDSIGVTIVPFLGESYSGQGVNIDNIDIKVRIKYAKIHKGFLLGALDVNKKENGNFLVIDAYDVKSIKDLVIESFKKKLGIKNCLEIKIKNILNKMKDEIEDFKFAENSNQFLKKLYGVSGKEISSFSRYYSHNLASLTDSSKRDGHGLLGKCLLESYLCGDQDYFAIFIRLSKKDFKYLSNTNQKEFTFINGHKYINNLNFDDLEFKDQKLKDKVISINKINIFQNRQNELFKLLKREFEKGNIRIKNY